MSETGDADSPKPRPALVALHAFQLTLAVIILGLAAYAVRFIAYNVLVYTLVVAICTILVCTYLIASHTYLRNIYSPYVAAAYHLWMLIFWVVDLGLFARLAQLWQGPECTYQFQNGFTCAPYEKRDATTTYGTFYGALVAGAVLAAFEFSLWILTTTMVFMYARKAHAAKSQQSGTQRQSTVPDVTSLDIELQPTVSQAKFSGPYQTVLLTPPSAALPQPWDVPEAELNRPGPQPLISDDDGISKDVLSIIRRNLAELNEHNTPHAVFAEEQESQGTPTPRPLAPTYEARNGRFRVTNGSDDDSVFSIGD